MKKPACLLLGVLIFLSGCAGRTANPVAAYSPGDETWSCEGLKAEIAQLQADMQRLLRSIDPESQKSEETKTIRQKEYEEIRKAEPAKKVVPTTRDYCKYSDTGEVFVIETNQQGIVVGSCGPLEKDLQPLHRYKLTTDKIVELQAVRDELILLTAEEKRRLAGPVIVYFWKHRDTGKIYLIEMGWRNVVLAGCGPIIGRPAPLATYALTTEKNAELETYLENDELVWLGHEVNQ